MTKKHYDHTIPQPTDDDIRRIEGLLRKVGGHNVVWGAGQVLDIWTLEQRAKLDQQMNKQLNTTSWVLAITTIALVFATVGLIWATLAA